jgi:hypothetical protein
MNANIIIELGAIQKTLFMPAWARGLKQNKIVAFRQV